jgi:hypothetical protein
MGSTPPECFDCDESDGRLTIRYRWFTPILLLAPFMLWYAAAVTKECYDGRHQSVLLLALLPLCAGAVALLAYGSLATLTNHTRLIVDDSGITVENGPLPWPGSRHIPHSGSASSIAAAGRSWWAGGARPPRTRNGSRARSSSVWRARRAEDHHSPRR